MNSVHSIFYSYIETFIILHHDKKAISSLFLLFVGLTVKFRSFLCFWSAHSRSTIQLSLHRKVYLVCHFKFLQSVRFVLSLFSRTTSEIRHLTTTKIFDLSSHYFWCDWIHHLLDSILHGKFNDWHDCRTCSYLGSCSIGVLSNIDCFRSQSSDDCWLSIRHFSSSFLCHQSLFSTIIDLLVIEHVSCSQYLCLVSSFLFLLRFCWRF